MIPFPGLNFFSRERDKEIARSKAEVETIARVSVHSHYSVCVCVCVSCVSESLRSFLTVAFYDLHKSISIGPNPI